MDACVFAPIHNVPFGFGLLEKIKSWSEKIYMESTCGLYLQGNVHLLIYPDHTKTPF